MGKDIKYWSNVSIRIFYIILAIIGIYIAYKSAVFYMPFLIAFIISLLIEPAIRFIMRKFKITRRLSAIIIFIITFGIIIGRCNMGINNTYFGISQSTTGFK